MYLLITILRSMRADFAPELWKGLGEPTPPNIFIRSETLVTIGVLAIIGCGVLIRDNRRAFLTALVTSMAGLGLIAIAAATRNAAAIGGFTFMVLAGLGLYLPYVAMHTTIFERLIAMTRDRGNIGYFMYLADAIGYLGYVAVMLVRATVSVGDDFIGFFLTASWLVVGLSAICLVLSWMYFASPLRCQPAVDSAR